MTSSFAIAGLDNPSATAFARNWPALLVLDLAMPDMDGLMRTLRHQTRWGRVPVKPVTLS